MIENLYTSFREIVSFNEADRVLHYDLKKSLDFIKKFSVTSDMGE
jgi:histidine ammonia-lyase